MGADFVYPRHLFVASAAASWTEVTAGMERSMVAAKQKFAAGAVFKLMNPEDR